MLHIHRQDKVYLRFASLAAAYMHRETGYNMPRTRFALLLYIYITCSRHGHTHSFCAPRCYTYRQDKTWYIHIGFVSLAAAAAYIVLIEQGMVDMVLYIYIRSASLAAAATAAACVRACVHCTYLLYIDKDMVQYTFVLGRLLLLLLLLEHVHRT